MWRRNALGLHVPLLIPKCSIQPQYRPQPNRDDETKSAYKRAEDPFPASFRTQFLHEVKKDTPHGPCYGFHNKRPYFPVFAPFWFPLYSEKEEAH